MLEQKVRFIAEFSSYWSIFESEFLLLSRSGWAWKRNKNEIRIIVVKKIKRFINKHKKLPVSNEIYAIDLLKAHKKSVSFLKKQTFT